MESDKQQPGQRGHDRALGGKVATDPIPERSLRSGVRELG